MCEFCQGKGYIMYRSWTYPCWMCSGTGRKEVAEENEDKRKKKLFLAEYEDHEAKIVDEPRGDEPAKKKLKKAHERKD